MIAVTDFLCYDLKLESGRYVRRTRPKLRQPIYCTGLLRDYNVIRESIQLLRFRVVAVF